MLKNLNKDNINEILSEMTTEQKIGMTYCARCFRESDVEFTISLIKNVQSVAFSLSQATKQLTKLYSKQLIIL